MAETTAPLDYQLSAIDKFFAFLGIFFGFMFPLFFTIPGWFGIRAWGRYNRGEPSSIRVYVLMGLFFGVSLAGSFVVAISAPLWSGG